MNSAMELWGHMDKQHVQLSGRKTATAALLLAAMGFAPMASAQLELNFLPAVKPDPNNQYLKTYVTCRHSADEYCIRGLHDTNPRKIDPDLTPFLMEMAQDPTTGDYFYHTLVGDPNSDFSQESYIATTNGFWADGFIKTSSEGQLNGGIDATPPNSGILNPSVTGIFYDPLSQSSLSGNGSGRPDDIVFRQTVKSAGFVQETIKANRLNKPKITQAVNEAGMSSNFVLDMSALTYFGAAAQVTGASMINTLLITDTQTDEVLTNFDVNTSSQKSNINAGKYIYNFGNGSGGSNGTYTYETSVYDIYSTNWAAFSDPTVNVPNF